MKMLWLIRHCESMANAGHVTADPTSIPLTDLGQEQAKLLPHSFDKVPGLIVTSPFLRTQQSSVHVREKFSDVPHEEWPVQEFSYLCTKRYANTDMAARRPAVKEYWGKCDPQYCDGDGAESFSDLMDRIDNTIEKVQSRPEKFIAIFTHGQFMKTFWWMIQSSHANYRNDVARMKGAQEFMNRLDISNGAILKLKMFGNNGWDISLLRLKDDELKRAMVSQLS